MNGQNTKDGLFSRRSQNGAGGGATAVLRRLNNGILDEE
jgi:hypothetical protein